MNEDDIRIYKEAIKNGNIKPLTDSEYQKLYEKESKTKISSPKKLIIKQNEKPMPIEIQNNWEKYCKAILRGPTKIKKEDKKQLMSYDDAKLKVFEILIEHEKLTRKGNNFYYPDGRIFEIRDSIKIALQQLTKYFILDNSCEYNLYKGLFIHGTVGVGKTTLSEVFEKFTNKYDLPTKFKIIEANYISDKVSENGIKEIKNIFQQSMGKAILIDDIGAEKITKRYGQSVDTIQEIVYSAIKRFRRSGAKIHATSNLGSFIDFGKGMLIDKYDSRVVDRCNQLFNYIPITGKSFRI